MIRAKPEIMSITITIFLAALSFILPALNIPMDQLQKAVAILKQLCAEIKA